MVCPAVDRRVPNAQPEYPHNARILTPAQRDLAVWRLEQEAGVGEAHEDVSSVKAYLSALADPKVRTTMLRKADPSALLPHRLHPHVSGYGHCR